MTEEQEVPPIKMVAVGDGAIGKTCLLISYAKNEFPKTYIPTVFDNMTIEKLTKINNEDQKVSIDLWDTAGQEEFDRIRPLSYRDTHVFLVCFSVVSPASFENLDNKWIPEIEHHEKNALKLLVGLKCDLRDDERELKKLKELDKSPVTKQQVEEYVKKSNSIGYVECSALKQIRVQEVFDTAIRAFLQPSDRPPETKGSSCCTIL